jgi:hypothetical protein
MGLPAQAAGVAHVKISVIVPSFNQGRFIEETIRSIVRQAWPELELIIIDGGSTDETLDVIRKYESSIAYWISEPDRGQADAINKGLRKATGDVVTWFSADDLYADGIFAALEKRGRKNPRAIYAAPVANFYSRGRQTLLRPHGLTLENVIQYWQRRSLWHDPGLFWSRSVIDTVGEIDATLHYAFDYDYLIRALQHFSVEYIDHVAAGFRLHRHSKSISQTEQMMAETAAVSQRYWPLLDEVDREGFERPSTRARAARRVAAHSRKTRRFHWLAGTRVARTAVRGDGSIGAAGADRVDGALQAAFADALFLSSGWHPARGDEWPEDRAILVPCGGIVSSLSEAFLTLATRHGADGATAQAWWREVESRYSEPHRRYHTIEHIRELLALLAEDERGGPRRGLVPRPHLRPPWCERGAKRRRRARGPGRPAFSARHRRPRHEDDSGDPPSRSRRSTRRRHAVPRCRPGHSRQSPRALP